MKGALADFQLRGWLLMKIPLAEIADDLFAPVEFRVGREEHNLWIQAVAKFLFVRCIECFDASMHFVLHRRHHFSAVSFVRCRHMNRLLSEGNAGTQFSQEIDSQDAVDFSSASLSNG